MYNVYKISPARCYAGESLVAAESVEEANIYIDEFSARDRYNHEDSGGYCYVCEDDLIPNVFSKVKGIVDYGIYWRG